LHFTVPTLQIGFELGIGLALALGLVLTVLVSDLGSGDSEATVYSSCMENEIFVQVIDNSPTNQHAVGQSSCELVNSQTNQLT